VSVFECEATLAITVRTRPLKEKNFPSLVCCAADEVIDSRPSPFRCTCVCVTYVCVRVFEDSLTRSEKWPSPFQTSAFALSACLLLDGKALIFL